MKKCIHCNRLVSLETMINNIYCSIQCALESLKWHKKNYRR